jgi:hypothetical protein
MLGIFNKFPRNAVRLRFPDGSETELLRPAKWPPSRPWGVLAYRSGSIWKSGNGGGSNA